MMRTSCLYCAWQSHVVRGPQLGACLTILLPGLCSAGEGPFPGEAAALEKALTPCPLLPAQVLAGLLHLGNVRFADSEDEAQPCQLRGDATCEDGVGAWAQVWSHHQGAGPVLSGKEPALLGLGGQARG